MSHHKRNDSGFYLLIAWLFIAMAILYVYVFFEPLSMYITWTINEGDPLNDWLTHLPVFSRPVVRYLGEIIAYFVGG